MSNRRQARAGAALVLISIIALLIGACAAAAPSLHDTDASLDQQAGVPVPAAREAESDTTRERNAASQTGRQDDALVVHTGRLRLEVREIAPAIESAISQVVDLGGYVSGSEEENTSTRHTATITFRIPAARWNDALRGLRGLAERVLNESTEAVEVTAEVIDLEARIANLRASEAALQEIMTRAGTIKDVLEVQRELSSVRGQIEQLTASRDHLRDKAAYGTLSVEFGAPVEAVALAQEGWQLSAEVDNAVADLVRVSQAATTAAIWLLVVALPVSLPLLIVVLVAWRFRRRFTPGTPPPAV